MNCACGRAVAIPTRGLCRPCYDRQRLARIRFGGHRQAVLERDGRRCVVCAAGDQLIVHHRRPREHDPDLLITLCTRCHVRLHRRRRFRGWVPELLLTLWAEQHGDAPVQLQFDLV